ncbi:MAG: IS110 family transposase [Nitrospira sp.]|nr:IS110 family transposase [Nitrospira sp.]
MTKHVAGLDVGKHDRAVSLARGPVRRFPNTPPGVTALAAWVRRHAVTHVECEATGGYERLLVQRLRRTEVAVSGAHPTKVRAFARSVGQGAKTDPLDAQILAHYGEVFDLPVEAAQEEASAEGRALLGRRQQLLDQRTQEHNRLEKGLQGRGKQSCQRHLAWLDKEWQHLEEDYQQAVQAKPELAERAALYQSVRGGAGGGMLTAATLLAYVPELGQGSGKALTALVGLVPWAADRGTHRGYRAIRGGRGLVRRALYMAALSVTRTNTDLGQFYRGLRRRGKPGKVALVAVIRKLLLRLHAMARRGTPGVPDGAPAG